MTGTACGSFVIVLFEEGHLLLFADKYLYRQSLQYTVRQPHTANTRSVAQGFRPVVYFVPGELEKFML
jgi:hypothetical protein